MGDALNQIFHQRDKSRVAPQFVHQKVKGVIERYGLN